GVDGKSAEGLERRFVVLAAAPVVVPAGGLAPGVALGCGLRSRRASATGAAALAEAGATTLLAAAETGVAPESAAGRGTGAEAAALRAAAAAAEATTRPAGAGVAVDLRGRVAQRRSDLVDVELGDGPPLAFLGLVGPRLEPTLDDDAHALLQGLRHVLGRLAP